MSTVLKIFVTMGLKRLIDSVAEVFYPRLCPVCGERLVAGERSVCLSCLAVMPRVGIAQGGCPDVERMLLGSRLVERAVSMFEYHRASPYAEILKDAKYRNSPRIVYDMARLFACELLSGGFFDGVDMVVPVPLHSSRDSRISVGRRPLQGIKALVRMAASRSRGVAAATGIRMVEALAAVKRHSTQTHRSVADRHANVAGVFVAKLEVGEKHVLLVDDVITTGSTVIACCDALQVAGAASVRVLSLGFAGGM